MAEIVPVVSEALEAQVRDLLPSQRGFGEDLQASNVITPIIDLTAAAQGTTTPQYMQRALAFGSQNTFSITAAQPTLANAPGFWQFSAIYYANSTNTGLNSNTEVNLTNGLSTKILFQYLSGGDDTNTNLIDFVVFLNTGESININVGSGANCVGSYRQVADVNGNLVNPSGFTPQ